MTQVIEAQMDKLETKVRMFDDLETLLVQEREQVERFRQQLFADRVMLQVVTSSGGVPYHLNPPPNFNIGFQV